MSGTPLARAFVRLEIDRMNLNNSIEGAVRSGGQAGQQEADKQAAAIKSRFVRGLQFGAGIFAAQGIINTIKSIGSFAVGAASDLEQVRIGFTTMLGSTQQANQFIGQLQQFAKATPFNLGDLEKESQRLLAMGFSARDIVPDLTAVGDAVAAMAGSGADIDRITYALGQMNQEAHINAGDLRQLTDVGIPALKILADGFHVTTAQLQDMITKGQIAGSQAIPILIDGLEHGTKSVKGFAGAMDDQSHTLQGMMSNLEDSTQHAFATGLQPLLKGLEAGLPAAITVAGTSVHGLTSILAGLVTGGVDVVHFFESNHDAAVALAGVLSAALIPKLAELAVTAEQFVAAKLADAFAASAGGIRAMGAAIVANPELYGLSAALAAAGVAVELFGSHERSVKLDVEGLTEAVRKQVTGLSSSVQDNLVNQFASDKVHDNRGETMLQYLQRYKVDVNALVNELAAGGGDQALTDLFNHQDSLLAAITNDQSISPNTYSGIVEYFKKIISTVDATKDSEQRLADVHAAAVKKLNETPQGRFVLFMQDVKKAQDGLTQSTKDNNQLIGGQIDLLKGYQAQAEVTAQSIQKNILDSIRTMASEGDNINKLAGNGVDPKFIQQLVKEGPEYVAAVASSSKQLQVQLGQQFEQGLTQQMHTAAAAARAEAPEAAKTVADAAALAAAAQKATLQKQFYGAVQGAVDEARQLAADGGDSATTAFGARAEAGKNAVLTHMLAALPEPVREAALSALGIATDAGGKLPNDLAAAINAHKPVAQRAAELLRAAVQGRIDLLHDKTIDVNVRDDATDQLHTIQQAIAGVATAVSEFHFFGGGAPMQGPVVPGGHRRDGGPITGPGGPRDDRVAFWGSNGEWVVDARSTAANMSALSWLKANPGAKLPGFADGGLVGTDGVAIGDFWRILLDYTNMSKSVANAAQPFAQMGSASAGGAGVQRWAGLVTQVLGMLSLPVGLAGKVLAQMNFESGGNPNAINLSPSDYNFAHYGFTGASRGLMQTIPGTFAAYAGALAARGIFDPLANIFAGVNYELHKGGPSLPDFGSGHGYDNGGGLPPGWTAAYNGTGRVENVQTADEQDHQLARLDQLVAQMERLIAEVRSAAPRTGAAVGSALNGSARSARLDARTRTRLGA